MSKLILLFSGSYFKELYVQWNKLKAVIVYISWCTLDINLSVDNRNLLDKVLKLHC